MIKNSKMKSQVVLIRGAGEQASGVGWVLAKAGFRVVMTEVGQPLMVRRAVCFGTAVDQGQWEVEGLSAVKVATPLECPKVWEEGQIPILIDPNLIHLKELNPTVLVDGIMAKRNLGTRQEMAPLTIGLGPGFCAGIDVHRVIETNRGHNMGRIISYGRAEPNTGVPGSVDGFALERVLYSEMSGIFTSKKKIGEKVIAGEIIGEITNEKGRSTVRSEISGILRGLIQTGTFVREKVKIGDIDPRGKRDYCWTISEKARAIGAAVLLSIIEYQKTRSVETED